MANEYFHLPQFMFMFAQFVEKQEQSHGVIKIKDNRSWFGMLNQLKVRLIKLLFLKIILNKTFKVNSYILETLIFIYVKFQKRDSSPLPPSKKKVIKLPFEQKLRKNGSLITLILYWRHQNIYIEVIYIPGQLYPHYKYRNLFQAC